MISMLREMQLAIALVVIIFGIIQLLYRNSGTLNFCMAVALLSLGYILLYFWCVRHNLLELIPLLINTEIAATYFSAAGIYLTFTTILSEQENPPAQYQRHFIVPVVLLIADILANLIMILTTGKTLTPEVLTRNINENVIILVFSITGDLVFLGYICAAVIHGIRIWIRNEITHKSHFLYMFAFLVCLLFVAVMFIVVRIINDPIIVEYLSYFCGFLVIIFCVIGFRYPEYSQRVLKTVTGQNKRRDNLETRNTESLMGGLVSLMDTGKIYKNPELSLEDVADYMGIPAQMVSQLINRRLKMNFKTFINTYRINAIRAELLSHPDSTILEIAFGNGFNSKSTFNTAFQEITGKTPRQYRSNPNPAQTEKDPKRLKSKVAK